MANPQACMLLKFSKPNVEWTWLSITGSIEKMAAHCFCCVMYLETSHEYMADFR